MTAITVGTGSDLPSGANTLTKALVWAIGKCQILQPKKQFILDYQFPIQPMFSVNLVWHRDYGRRLAVAWILEMPNDYLVVETKLWKQPLAIPFDENSPQNASQSFNPGTGGTLPSDVNSFPRLLYWLGSALDLTTPSIFVTENDDVGSLRACSIITGQNPDGKTLSRGRFSIALQDDYVVRTDGLWAACKEFSSVSLPESLLSN